MSGSSAIEWTDATWNPVRGCTKVSPGCAHCYAETFAERWRGVPGHPYEQGFDLRLVPEKLREPLSWQKPRRVFVNSMSDLFQDGVPDAFIDRVFAVMALAPQHTFQLLTKRADRMRDYLSQHDIGLRWLVRLNVGSEKHQDKWAYQEADAVRWTREGLPNVWLGVSVENQHFANERIPLLLKTPAAVRFISAEPLLGELSFRWARWDDGTPHPRRLQQRPAVERDGKTFAGSVNHLDGLRMLDWVIIGGESGPGARPCKVAWIRQVVQQCRAAGVPVFVKQLGARIIDRNNAGFLGEEPTDWPDVIDIEDRVEHDLDGTRDGYQGAPVRIHLHDRKGGDLSEWPEDLRVREFPSPSQGATTCATAP